MRYRVLGSSGSDLSERTLLESLLNRFVNQSQLNESSVTRSSETTRKQRAGSAFVGGYGRKTGSSDLLFVEGQLPKKDDEVASRESPSRQLELCLRNLERQLDQRGHQMNDILQLTLYLSDMEAYDRLDETYEQYFDDTRPARTTVGVCELLGGAAVTVDAVVAVE